MYYLWLNEAQAGPYSLQQVRSMWNAGQITALTLYWQEGKADWQPLGQILSEIEQAPAASHSPVVAPGAPTASEPEQVHWTGHPTWWKWGWWLLLAAVLVAAGGGLFIFAQLPPLLNLAPPAAALLIMIYVFIERRITRYTVTNRRVSIESGIFERKSRELRIQDIRSIAADMNFLGYGDIEFSSAARDDAEVVFSAVARAGAVRDMVKKLQN